jgi:hypothetical protein
MNAYKSEIVPADENADEAIENSQDQNRAEGEEHQAKPATGRLPARASQNRATLSSL